MTSLDDTQPRSPFAEQAQPPLLNEQPPDEPAGPGCLFWGVIGGTAMLFALAIVLLAAAAGWTAGQREADRHATATQSEVIGAQLFRVPTDVAGQNLLILSRRLNYLETVAPDLAAVGEIRQTATALYFAVQPTLTPTLTATTEATPLPEVTEEPEVTPETEVTPDASGGYDLAGLLQTARQQYSAGEYREAYETLDAIQRIDPNFQQATVNGLIFDTLTTIARRLYLSTETLAEAIRYTDLAEQYGNVGNLSFERLIAALYLDLQRTTSHADKVRIINQIRSYSVTDYQGQNMNRLLFNEYVRYAEVLEMSTDYCQAVVQYNNALNVFADNAISGRRDTAQMLCEQGTPTPGAEGETPIAPIGVPGT